MKKRIYKNLLALTLACSVALSTAPVSSFARDVAAVSESEATTEAPKEKATEVEKKTEVSKDATTVTEKTEASEEKTTAAEKTESPEEKTIAAEKTKTSEEKTTSKKTKTSEKKATDPECVKPDKPVVDGPTPEGKKDTDEATKPSTVTLHFNQSMPGHVLSVSKASSFNFGGYASDKKATVKASYVGMVKDTLPAHLPTKQELIQKLYMLLTQLTLLHQFQEHIQSQELTLILSSTIQ